MADLDNPIIQSIGLEMLTEYITTSGQWIKGDATSNFTVYQGRISGHNDVELILPLRESSDWPTRVKDAVDLLSTVYEMSPVEMARTIRAIDRDILLERLPADEDPQESTISLKAANQSVTMLTKLVGSAAVVESNPDLEKQNKAAATEMIRRARFGHTFRGSFGFAVEMPVPENPKISAAPELPRERRVMQRIVRGIKLAHQAVTREDPDVLVVGATTGFNASMLSAVLAFRRAFPEMNPEYSVRWTPRWAAETDVKNASGLMLARRTSSQRMGAKILTEALKELQLLEARKDTTITGYVEVLKKKIDWSIYLGDETRGVQRTVTIEGKDDRGKDLRVTTVLPANDYKVALEAHDKNMRISVKGKLVRKGMKSTIVSPHNVEILPD